MTIKEAKERIEELYNQGLITKAERDARMQDPDILKKTDQDIQREKNIREETARAIRKLEADHTKLLSKERGIIKVCDLVKLDPLFLKSDAIGLVIEVRKTSYINFLYIKWTGIEPEHYELSDRLGTKEYYFIKI